MKHIFVFIGEGMTGKSILGNICNFNQQTKVYDDVDLRSDKEIKHIVQMVQDQLNIRSLNTARLGR